MDWKFRTRAKQLIALAVGVRRLRRRRSVAREVVLERARIEAARVGMSVDLQGYVPPVAEASS